MIIKEESEAIRQQSIDSNFLYPNYKRNCISNIPGTILDLFDIKNKRKISTNNIAKEKITKVVLLVLDGFGYNQFLRVYKEYKLLKNLAKKGQIFPLTSIFPSQTTNALATLNTGLTPQEHGLFEYYIYLKKIDSIINTLRFEPLDTNYRDEFLDKRFNPIKLFKKETIHTILRNSGVKTFTHISTSYAHTPCSQLLFDGSIIIPSLKTSDLIVNLRKNLEKENGPAYFFVHISNLDTIAHKYGPSSCEYAAELSAISYLLQKELVQKIDQKTAKETLVLITADHGEVDIIPEKTTYLNWFPDVVEKFENGKGGKKILPTGSARDVFLHIKEEELIETKNLLNKKIGSKAKIVETKEAMEDELFGLGDVENLFLENVGNLLILPYQNNTVWFEHFENRKVTLHGHHGGLNEEEMIVPFAISKIIDLKKIKING